MRVLTRRALAGVVTALGTYLLTAYTVRGRLPEVLTGAGEPLARAYAAEPFEMAVGWVFLTSHRIPLYAVGPEEVLAIGLHIPLAAGAAWLYAIPAVGCLAGGAAVGLLDGPADPLAVGGTVAVGYVPAVFGGVLVFRGGSGPVAVVPNVASVVTVDWPIAVVGYPVVFAALGALLVQEVRVVWSSR